MKKLLACLLTLCLTVGMTAALAENATAAPSATASPAATTAPNDSGMPFLLDDNDGAPVKLSDWKGLPTYLNFFTTWCGYCKAEMPDLKALQEKYGENLRVVLVHVPSGEDEQTARDYLAANGLDQMNFVEDNGFFEYMYGISGFPMSVIIDKDGYLSSVYSGAIDSDTMAEAVEKAGATLPEEDAHAD